MAKMTAEQKAAAKRLREARASRERENARIRAWEEEQDRKREEQARIRAETLAIRARQQATLPEPAQPTPKPQPSALALTRRRNAAARAAAALAARKAEEEARAKAAERAALASTQYQPQPQPALTQRQVDLPTPRLAPRVTLRSPQAGLWEITVQDRLSVFVIPFYQYGRPDPKEAAEAIAAEMLRRRQLVLSSVKTTKPRKDKARVISPMPRGDSPTIRRIERQMEGV